MVGYGGEDVVDLLENSAFTNLGFEGIDYFRGLFLAKFLIFEQLVSDHKTFIIPLLDRLLYLLVVGLIGQVHGLDLLVDVFIDLKLVIFLNRQVNGQVRIDGDMRSEPRMSSYFVYAYAFVGVDLEHASDEVSSQGVDVVRNGVNAF